MMTDAGTFLERAIAARRATWLVFGIAVALQLLVYFAFLGMEKGSMDGFIESGLYGDIPRPELARITFYYAAALKLMNTAILMGALFLTLWIRGLRRIA